MRYLILSDVHGNSDALEAVLEAAPPEGFDRVLVLGDLVGYGAGPDRVVELVRALGERALVIRGNHDKVVAGLENGFNFNELALAAALWSRETMGEENLAFVQDLVRGPLDVGDGSTVICHGSPLDEDAYLFSVADGARALSATSGRVIFFGHTHLPTAFVCSETAGETVRIDEPTGTMKLSGDGRYLLNPGAVGQPRDRDPRAAYMTFDAEADEVTWQRTPYAVERAQERILDAGLPSILADRLAFGF